MRNCRSSLILWKQNLTTIEGDTGLVLKQYQIMIGILQAYRNEDIMSVAKLYVDLDTSLITDEGVLEIANAVTADMQTTGYQTLEDLGTAAWNAGKKEEAMEYYKKSLEINPENPSATYLLGRLYQNAGDTENARQCFSRIITVFPESEQASQAASAMGEMGLATAASGQSTAESEADRNRETTAAKETERDRQEEDNPPETTQAENVPETIPETAPEPVPETVPVNDVN